jgi:hypothetical protein
VIEPGEDCDGGDMGGMTCNTVTMGAFPLGALYCTPNCLFDTSACYSQWGAGGAVGAGGATGTGGMPSWQEQCFQGEGVPLAGTPECAYGDEAVRACVVDYWGTTGSTYQVGCGCQNCPGTMARCATDFACTWILGCGMQSGCGTLASCYESYPACADIIDRSGGRRSVGAGLARSAFTCLTNAACM